VSRPHFFQASILFAAALLAQAAFGQGRGGATTPPPSGNPGTGGTAPGNSPTTTRNPTTPGQPTNPSPTIQQPIFLSGRVMLEDGTAPSESLVIERVCSGRPRADALRRRRWKLPSC